MKRGRASRATPKVDPRKRTGRPPRRDDPQRIQIVLPGKLRAWLRVEAARQAKDQGDIITEALVAYRAQKKRMA
jgi:hypothetical protein